MKVSLNKHNNNFDFLRCMAAIAVMYGHCCVLRGLRIPNIYWPACSIFGLYVFFSISGFLITNSWVSDPNLFSFFAKRCGRIFPALIAVVAITAFILGPSVGSLPIRQYFSSHGSWAYLSNVWLYTQFALPGVFEHNSYKGSVNESLWSLAPEFFCYVLIGVLGALTRYWIKGVIPFIAAVVGALVIYRAYYFGPRIFVYQTDVFMAAVVMTYFFVGALVGIFKIPLRMDVAFLLLFLFSASVGNVDAKYSEPIMWVAIPYATIAFGVASTPVICRFGRFGDFSYGLYLYSFPITQLVLNFRPNISLCPLVTIVATVALVLSFASWHLIEMPFLEAVRSLLKKRKAHGHRGSLLAP